MNYEIEVHPVGDASKAGDAMSVRYGLEGQYKIIVIDGGTEESGSKLVEHIKRHYGEDAEIEHVISTHPDQDHACGLREILKNFTVRNLWIHGLWYHAAEMLPYFSDKRWTVEGLAVAIRKQYPIVEELIDLAQEHGAKIYEPFQGQSIGPFTVLSPNRETYIRLVPQFRRTPDADVDALSGEKMYLGAPKGVLAQAINSLVEKALTWAEESWDIELLREGAATSAENESCTVLYGKFPDASILLTADAGVNGLSWAMNYADGIGIPISQVNLVQVPHHGSRSNVTPSLLDRLLGEKLPEGSTPLREGFVSSPKDDSKHPRKMVINAFRRRGTPVHKTQGTWLRKQSGMTPRENEVNSVPFELFTDVEDYDN